MDEKQKTKTKPRTPKYDPYCPKCNTCWIEDNNQKFHYCPYCGTKLIRSLTCPICSGPNQGDWEFCVRCGVSLMAAK